MTLNDKFRYEGHGQPVVVPRKWGEGGHTSYNNSGSSKNVSHYLGAGVPADNNQFLHYKRTDECIETFRNNITQYNPNNNTQCSPAYLRSITYQPNHIKPHEINVKNSPTCNRLPPRPHYETVTPELDYYNCEGPFVFGVHTPSHFHQYKKQNNDTYDYADVDDNKSVIDNSESDKLFCDKNNSIMIKSCTQSEHNETNRNVYSIDDSRTKNKKDKNRRKKKKVKAKIKCIFIGDGAVGKTSLITSYAQNVFSNEYKPTTFDKYNVVVEVDGNPVSLQLCDTAGQDSLKELRELCYPGSDVIILCFSIMKPDSFKSLVDKWIPAVESLKAPFILVGTQGDLIDCPVAINQLKIHGQSPVSDLDAKKLATTLNAPYIETSSKTRLRLKDAFDAAILAALPFVKKKRPFWKKLFCIS